ncbi:MAG: hypothetical protein Q8N10_03440 [Phenylobacterium sp.]|uniref:hypothetical protein n=1 Tax=Phenylobacterium sp. TaxID=1871053 RepID=UPI002727AECA|nr:hypothetical protein [Phenylobacterium sp.]MDO8912324.1 hypothetical protein [Phenylobacterium sp.]MDP3099536.1 hypothetical protein [Phenylobacterium sp.]
MVNEQAAIHSATQTLLVDVLRIIHRIAPADVEALLAESEQVASSAETRNPPPSENAKLVLQLRVEMLREVLEPPTREP